MARVVPIIVVASLFTLEAASQVEEAARTPIVVPGIADAAEAAVGNHIYFVRLKNGTVMSWGYNNAGQLGNGRTGPTAGMEAGKTLPYVVQGKAEVIPGLIDVKSIAAGGDHALAVKNDGSVWTWGRGSHGANPSPVRVAGVSRAAAVAAYNDVSYVLLEDGTVVGWGDKLWRANGRAASSDKPMAVPGLHDVVSIAAGLPCLALLRDGSVMAWGSGILGDGSPPQVDYAATVVPQPAKVSGIDDAVAIATGANTSAAIRKDGSVWIWGNTQPQQHLVPVKMPNLPKAVDVALGSGSSIVFADGTLRTWGDARLGATGRPGIERIASPVPVPGVDDLVRVWSRFYSNLGLTRDGRIVAWGSVYVAR
jgi:alpha-tubulin suppressor-like RCC1 family protein